MAEIKSEYPTPKNEADQLRNQVKFYKQTAELFKELTAEFNTAMKPANFQKWLSELSSNIDNKMKDVNANILTTLNNSSDSSTKSSNSMKDTCTLPTDDSFRLSSEKEKNQDMQD